jgi:DNA polymerase I-like protein with 3'-5' exonuclease and polymerase domains
MRDASFDTETTGLNWAKGDVPFLLQVADNDSPNGEFALMGPAIEFLHDAVLPEDHEYAVGEKYVNELLDRLSVANRDFGHNTPFDVHQLAGVGVGLSRPWADTQTLAQIVAPERRFAEKGGYDEDGNYTESMQGYHLKDLSKVFVDPHAKDSEQELERLAKLHGFSLKAKPGADDYVESSYFRLWQVEPEAMEFYAREDVRLTLGLAAKLESRLTGIGLDEFLDDWKANQDKRGTRTIWDLEQRLAPIIWEAEHTGIRVDGEAAKPLREEYARQAARAHDALTAALGSSWDQNNDTLAEALLSVGVPLRETTASGQVAVNAKALGVFEDQYPIIKTLFEYRQAEKFVSTYLDHLVGQDIIHPTFSPIGAWTGRMSGREPNMQNIPVHAGTAVRELFLPREGMGFVGMDFEQIELRALGYYLNNDTVIRLIEEADYFAHQAARTTLAGMEEHAHAGDEDYFHKGQPGAEWRQTNKNATYAIVYGVGAPKLGKMLGWPADSVFTENDWVVQRGYKHPGDPRNLKAESFIKMVKRELKGYGTPYYNERRPGSGLMGRVGKKVAMTGSVSTILGRYQWLGYDGGWKALSALIQGGAADIFKLAVLLATAAVAHLGAYPVLFIHDEILFEAPIDAVEEVARVGGAAMASVLPGFRPEIGVETNIGYKNWAEAK